MRVEGYRTLREIPKTQLSEWQTGWKRSENKSLRCLRLETGTMKLGTVFAASGKSLNRITATICISPRRIASRLRFGPHSWGSGAIYRRRDTMFYKDWWGTDCARAHRLRSIRSTSPGDWLSNHSTRPCGNAALDAVRAYPQLPQFLV